MRQFIRFFNLNKLSQLDRYFSSIVLSSNRYSLELLVVTNGRVV